MKVVEISSDEEDNIVIESNRNIKTRAAPQQGNEYAQTSSGNAQPPPPFQAQNETRPTSTDGKRETKSITVDVMIKPPSRQAAARPVTPEPPPPVVPEVDVDVNMDMADTHPDVNVNMQNSPKTPVRPKARISPPKEAGTEAPAPLAAKEAAEPLFIPALSKLPFIPITTLSEAELDMTVEDWIRYQMDAEFDKFRRDGERELQRFMKKAEEARKIIENL